MNYLGRNRESWDHGVMSRSVWAQPVDAATIAAARMGRWQVLLTPKTPVPQDWLAGIAGTDVLCLASGGGQQVPVLAAGEPLEFSHSLTEQIGGQLAAGFLLAGPYEDGWYDDSWAFANRSPICIATRAIKPRG